MPRYFIEVQYKGTVFKGFQNQLNGKTIQGELNQALSILLKELVQTTTSSRTDAGVHCLQNFLHFDTAVNITHKLIYNMNAILHRDIVIKNIYIVSDMQHARFDAISRSYTYHIIHEKNPFIQDVTYFYPFTLNIDRMNQAAQLLLQTSDFSSFAKRHSDVNNFLCKLSEAHWEIQKNRQYVFNVVSNRFLRGMVRALVATQLLVGRKKISLQQFQDIILSKDCTQSDFSAPPQGLFLEKVTYPADILTMPVRIEI